MAPAAALVSVFLFGEIAPAQSKRVVILYDERVELPGLSALDASLTRTLNQNSAVPPQIFRESMDLSRFGSARYRSELAGHLRAKYAGKKIDVVVAVMGPALDFALAGGAEMFPGAAIVFCGIDRREVAERRLPDNVTGVLVDRNFRTTLEIALRLHPQTQRVVVVGGTSDFDERLIEHAREEFRPFARAVAITVVTHLPMAALLEQLRSLPPRTIVLYTSLFRDGAGQPFVPHEAARLITEASNAPVYGFVDQYLGRGIVGGHLYSVDAHGEAAARQVLNVLAGGSLTQALPTEVGTSRYMFDWRQLQRWKIDVAQLPAGSEIRYRNPTAWSQYRGYILAAAMIALMQGLVILLLIAERGRRRQSQQRYALASASGRVSVWDWTPETGTIYVDPLLKSTLGYADHEIRNDFKDWSRLIHHEDMAFTNRIIQETMAGKTDFEGEYRMLHRDGSIRWVVMRGSITSKPGQSVRLTGTTTEITDRKIAEQELETTRAELTRVARLTALGQFAASVAHEVRQPLTTIALNVEVCLRWLRETQPRIPDIRAALIDVLHAGRLADEMIQRNRELFRMQSVSKEPLDIHSLIEEAVILAKPRLHHKQVNLTTSLTADMPLVTADRIELQQVLLNLIANAIDATDHLPPPQRWVTISTRLAGGEVRVAVRDNGVGLAAVDMQQLFKLSYTTKPSGTGIGLSLCRSIIEVHGGRIWAERNKGAGATFCFTVPVLIPFVIPVVGRVPGGNLTASG